MQVAALEWLWGLWVQGKGGILGDDMGLGKTRTMSSFLAGLTPVPGSSEASRRNPHPGMHVLNASGTEHSSVQKTAQTLSSIPCSCTSTQKVFQLSMFNWSVCGPMLSMDISWAYYSYCMVCRHEKISQRHRRRAYNTHRHLDD